MMLPIGAMIMRDDVDDDDDYYDDYDDVFVHVYIVLYNSHPLPEHAPLVSVGWRSSCKGSVDNVSCRISLHHSASKRKWLLTLLTFFFLYHTTGLLNSLDVKVSLTKNYKMHSLHCLYIILIFKKLRLNFHLATTFDAFNFAMRMNFRMPVFAILVRSTNRISTATISQNIFGCTFRNIKWLQTLCLILQRSISIETWSLCAWDWDYTDNWTMLATGFLIRPNSNFLIAIQWRTLHSGTTYF